MTSKEAIFKWNEEHQKAFEHMKWSISRETLLVYPDFSKPFDIHTNASKVQLGAVISQYNKPITFYSRKLNPAQVNYTTTERELLSIVETLKEFRNILLGQQIKVYNDHKNLTYKFNTERVMRWQLDLEELSPELIYIKGSKNIVADALSRLDKIDNLNNTSSNDKRVEPTLESLNEHFALNKEDVLHPTSFKTIMRFQQKDKSLIEIAKEKPNVYSIK